MDTQPKTNVTSEIGKLQGVILHRPGREVENMTPENAGRALYSDILNLDVARAEYADFCGAVARHAPVRYVEDLLRETLAQPQARGQVLDAIFGNGPVPLDRGELMAMPDAELARALIEGVELRRDTLANYLNPDRHALRPLHNLFFTRDASMTIGGEVLVGQMASPVRAREAQVMKAIFDHHPELRATTVAPADADRAQGPLTIEGGDVLVAREDILVIGMGLRTTAQGIDFVARRLAAQGPRRHIIVQELPTAPESFIHLDMVFTLLDRDTCMAYQPVVLGGRHATYHITADNGRTTVSAEESIPAALRKLGMDLRPVLCGGADPWTQQREQWHSGANFFALAPGKIIGYSRNAHTIEALSQAGFDVLPAAGVASGAVDIANRGRYVVAVDGSELPRGGGGARCMTMPFRREPVAW